MNLFLTSIWLCFTTWIAYYIAQSCQSTHLFLAAFVGLVAGLLVRF